MPDFRKSLQVLHAEWSSCTACELGQRRHEVGGGFVFGEGSTRGVMFIGEGPGKNEEEHGRPFIGDSGRLLRRALHKLQLTNVYITNVVACRSCAPAFTGEGQPIVRTDRSTGQVYQMIRDEPPSPACMAACAPRLHEQIYLVDPVLIVSLGKEATQALTGKSQGILAARGSTQEISIPGAWHRPVRTEKKQAWLRKVRGQVVLPTEQNQVRYLLLPTLHPAFVLRTIEDKRPENPLQLFTQDMRRAAQLYDRYMLETHGVQSGERYLSDDDIRDMDYQ